jgi:hypothetical protein
VVPGGLRERGDIVTDGGPTGWQEGLLAPTRRSTSPSRYYDGFPAVLVRLAKIPVDELEELLVDAWRCQAPRSLVDDFDAVHGR